MDAQQENDITYTFEYHRIPMATARRESLPKKGKPKVEHLVVCWDGRHCYAKGGMVVCTARYGYNVTHGVAVCSMSDTFSKKKGSGLAKARARAAMKGLSDNTGLLMDYIESVLNTAEEAYKEAPNGFSLTVANGRATAVLSWDARYGKKAE